MDISMALVTHKEAERQRRLAKGERKGLFARIKKWWNKPSYTSSYNPARDENYYWLADNSWRNRLGDDW